MKRFVVLFLILFLFSAVAFAESYGFDIPKWWDEEKGEVVSEELPLLVNENYVYSELPNGDIVIMLYIGNEKKADIAASFPGKRVVAIGYSAFCDVYVDYHIKIDGTKYTYKASGKLKEIIVPDTVQYLNFSAFGNWSTSESKNTYIYNIPSGLRYAESGAMAGTKLTTIPYLENAWIADHNFTNLHSVKKITFSPGYDVIKEGWLNATEIEEIVFPEGVIEIEHDAVKNNRRLQVVQLPNTIQSIGEKTFENCAKLSKINLPASITYIGEGAFKGCSSKAVFTVFTGTYAEQWANEHGYKTKVLVPVTEITLNEESATINKGKSFTLKATVGPKEATSKKVEWISTDPNVATVKDGKVQAKGCGSCDIICRAADGSGVQAVCHVSIIQMVTSLQAKPQKLTIPYGGTGEVGVTLKPEDATNQTLAWTSSDESICIVDENGKITAVGAGDCEIVCATTDGSNKSAKIKIHVPLFDTTKADYTVTEKIGLLIPVDLRGFSVADITHKSSSDKYFLYYFDTKGLHIIPVAEGAAKITLTSKLNKQDKIVYNVAVDKSALYDYTNSTDEQNEYILDKATSEFHYPSCPKADLIDNGNRGTFTGKRVELIRQFYNPCSECNIFLNDIPQVQVDYPKKLEPEGYNGPECWLLYESECSTKNTKIYKVYAKISTKDNNWHNQVKEVMKMLAQELENYDEYFVTMINIVNNMDEQYPNDIALWNSYPSNPRNKEKSPELVWYPNGSSMHADFTIEQWSP